MSRRTAAPTVRVGRHASAFLMATAIGVTSVGIFGAVAAARTGPEVAAPRTATFDQTAPAAQPIPLTPLTGVTSLDATVVIRADGIVDGKPTTGDLTARLSTNDQAMSQIDATGSLLGEIVAQVGGGAVKLLRPSQVSVYGVPAGTYAVVSGLFDLCVKAKDSAATAALDQLSPQGLMTILTSSDVAYGTYVGDEDLNGTPVKHYVISGDAFLAAAQASSDPTVSTFARSLTSATDADLYVAADTGYPVAYRGGFGGSFEPLKFDGSLTIEIDVTGMNANTPVVLPGACDHPISQ